MAKLFKKSFQTLLKRTTAGGTQEWKVSVEETANGTGVIEITHGLKDGKQQTIREEIKVGKNAGKKNETSPLQQAISEAESRWNKQKDRKGYGLTVEESAATRGTSPMLAKKYGEHAGKVDWGTAFAQPKLDGYRLIARCGDGGGPTQLLSRENQPVPALAPLLEILGDHVPVGMALDGEAYQHGATLSQISKGFKKKQDLSDQLEYHVYDLHTPDPFSVRSAWLRDIVKAIDHPRVIFVPTLQVHSEAELLKMQADFIDEGFEGAMLRSGGAGYEAGRRSASLLKVKTFQDDEFLVVGFKMGRGKYEGMPVFACQTKAGNPFDVLAPGSLPEKRALGSVANDMIGKLLKVKYAYYTTTDKPVPWHPVGLCFVD